MKGQAVDFFNGTELFYTECRSISDPEGLSFRALREDNVIGRFVGRVTSMVQKSEDPVLRLPAAVYVYSLIVDPRTSSRPHIETLWRLRH